MDLVQILKKNPGCFIFFQAEGQWVLYKSKETYDKLEKIIKNDPTGKEYDKYLDKITLCEWNDFPITDGYKDPLVEALATLSDISVDSI